MYVCMTDSLFANTEVILSVVMQNHGLGLETRV